MARASCPTEKDDIGRNWGRCPQFDHWLLPVGSRLLRLQKPDSLRAESEREEWCGLRAVKWVFGHAFGSHSQTAYIAQYFRHCAVPVL